MSLLTVLHPINRQDCRFIHNAHRRTVQHTCIRSYDGRILQAWEELLGVESYTEAMEDKKKTLWVAEYRGIV